MFGATLALILFTEEHMKAKGSYSVKKWDESTYEEISPKTKLTKASVEYAVTGEIEGKATEECLMFYKNFNAADPHSSTASYVGLIRFNVKLGGSSGSFVMTDEGTFAFGAANSRLQIQDGSGTDALKGIRGSGTYRADKDGVKFELEYEV